MRRIDLQHLREYLLALGNLGDGDEDDEFDELESTTSNSSRGNIPTTRSSSSSRSVTRNEASSSSASQSITANNSRRNQQQEQQQRYQNYIQQKREELKSNDIYFNIQKQTGKSNKSIPKNVFSNLMNRTHQMGKSTCIQANCKLSSPYLPSDPPETIDSFDHQVFCGRFSDDGSIFMSACQDQNIRLYSIESIQQSLLRKKMAKPFKTIAARDVGWSVVDCHYSPDQRFIIYSSWSPYIHLCTVGETNSEQQQLQHHQGQEALDLSPYSMRFCPFSIRFSPDSKEILAGASDSCLYLYDIERKRLVLRVENAHEDDINTVSFADQNSHIFFSGSDDTFIKVWDRRTFRNNSLQPVGIFCGHTSGLTYISSKQDGTYFISNGKDQCMKLWDIRKMKSSMDDIPKKPPTWDYRYMFRSTTHRIHPQDLSIMTYRGHSVLQTLIRCHFSPIETTGQSYLYTGSSDGKVYIYDILTGEVVKTLSGHTSIVRDVSWHPHLPLLLSSSWDTTTRAFSYHPKDIETVSTTTTHPTTTQHEDEELVEDEEEELEALLRRGQTILIQNDDDDDEEYIIDEEDLDGEEEDEEDTEDEDEEME